MIKEEEFLIITIDSTHLVMKVEKTLLEKGIDIRVIPLPSELKASCGFSLKGNIEDKERIEEILDREIQEKLYKFYLCKKQGIKKSFFPL